MPALRWSAFYDRAGAVDVALHDVTIKASARRDRPFEVDWPTCGQGTQVGPGQRLADHIGSELAVLRARHRHADSADRDRAAWRDRRCYERAANGQSGRIGKAVKPGDLTELFNDSREHLRLSSNLTHSQAPGARRAHRHRGSHRQ